MRGSLVQNNTARRGAAVHLETCEKRTRTLCAYNGVSSLLSSCFPPDCESWETSGTFPSITVVHLLFVPSTTAVPEL